MLDCAASAHRLVLDFVPWHVTQIVYENGSCLETCLHARLHINYSKSSRKSTSEIGHVSVFIKRHVTVLSKVIYFMKMDVKICELFSI